MKYKAPASSGAFCLAAALRMSDLRQKPKFTVEVVAATTNDDGRRASHRPVSQEL